jgi:hypothetical protein
MIREAVLAARSDVIGVVRTFGKNHGRRACQQSAKYTKMMLTIPNTPKATE